MPGTANFTRLKIHGSFHTAFCLPTFNHSSRSRLLGAMSPFRLPYTYNLSASLVDSTFWKYLESISIDFNLLQHTGFPPAHLASLLPLFPFHSFTPQPEGSLQNAVMTTVFLCLKPFWHATASMKLKDIMLSEISQTQKDKYCMIPLMWEQNSHIHRQKA